MNNCQSVVFARSNVLYVNGFENLVLSVCMLNTSVLYADDTTCVFIVD